MSGALEVAAIGMRAQQRALDAIANNISNVNTPAFKRSDVRFAELVASAPAAGAYDPVAGVDLATAPMLDRQGRIDATGDWRDVAIDGAGYLELMGPEGRTLLWRGGALRVLDDGALATSSGFVLKAGITVPTEATAVRIERDGAVYAVTPDAEDAVEIGRISLVRLSDAGAVSRLEGGVYVAADDSALITADPGEDGLGYVLQASVERSNVDLNTEMVGMLVSQRAYAANAQVIRAADELFNIANNLRR